MKTQRGCMDFDQMRAAARQGDGSMFQMAGTGGYSAGNVPMFDEEGNVIDSGKAASLIGPSSGGLPWVLEIPDLDTFPTVQFDTAAVSAISQGVRVVGSDATKAAARWATLSPASGYRVEMGLQCSGMPWAMDGANNMALVLGVSGGNVISFGCQYSTGYKLLVMNLTGVFGYVGTLLNQEYFGAPVGPFLMIGVEDDGVTRKYLYSVDGTWVTILATARTDHIVPDRIGFWISSAGSAPPISTVRHFKMEAL